ncbi:MAG TPA: phospholipase D-like domain-containing protein, partial [Gemmatimonadales bacterium]|nr:phospholipase D-like domain-containing protein [Gemmatimonadales bacterium]
AVLTEVGYYVAVVLTLALALAASIHAILYKRDSRAAVSWVGLIWLVPVAGPVLYALVGVNRIRRRAIEIRSQSPRLSGVYAAVLGAEHMLAPTLDPAHAHLVTLGRAVDRVTRRPLTRGNAVTPLVNGEDAYPAMLAAIREAEESLLLSTYIFDRDEVGEEFVDALGDAVGRGVVVRVLIDGVGARYSRPPIVGSLRQRGVTVARFIPTIAPWRAFFWNLRNHRKLLVADGRVGFTGGMNIRSGHVVSRTARRPVQDLHFRLQGPVLRHLTESFALDWAFTTREVLGPEWFPETGAAGSVAARGIMDGPDEDFEKLRRAILGAIASARESVRIITPYFLPDSGIITALTVAALRGVKVEILLPGTNNLPFVHWAMMATLWQVVKYDCLVYFQPPPFDHTKLMIVDGGWVRFGSSNWDARSLRLNFEFDVECYDAALAAELGALFDRKRDAATLVTPEQLDGRSLPLRLRDGIARLASPYL